MRLAATISLLVLLSAPMLAEEALTPEEVGRFITAAEEVVSTQPIPPGIPPARHLSDASSAEAIADRHGFTERRWELLARRIMTAHHVEVLVDQPAPERRRIAPPQPVNVSSGELRQQAAVASTMRDDLKALAAETQADRDAIRPYRARLDDLVAPR